MPPNRLSNEKSPYLLQHAGNPVDWYPWGDEAFAAARDLDRPIFLSIGYATCHWCHVMEHESFEDPVVAALMNEAFINIKVDREERPDIDQVYMTVCQMLTGSGGWPLTIIMTPDKEPFFAGTYLPRETRYGRTGMLDLVPRVQTIWNTERDESFLRTYTRAQAIAERLGMTEGAVSLRVVCMGVSTTPGRTATDVTPGSSTAPASSRENPTDSRASPMSTGCQLEDVRCSTRSS